MTPGGTVSSAEAAAHAPGLHGRDCAGALIKDRRLMAFGLRGFNLEVGPRYRERVPRS